MDGPDHTRARPGVAVLAAAVCACLALPRDAIGWTGREHRAIGAESYVAACKRLEPLSQRDPATAQRYEIACSNLDIQALIYGQSTGVSGDFLGDPSDFMTALGPSLVLQKSNYLRLALANSTHFHPAALREWRALHIMALESALAASQKTGVAQLEGFEEAVYESAFGDHFLQDSFASGHMGFNRPASSASAAVVFHDEWSRRGRTVSNRRGEVWRTYGDGRLESEECKEGRKHLLAAATESVYAVLTAFVLGTNDGASDLAVWREMVFTIEDPELVPRLESVFSRSETLNKPPLLPLLVVQRQAVKDGIIGAWSSFTTSFEEPGDPSGALVLGGDLLIPGVGMRIEAGLGIGYATSLKEPRFAIDAGLVRGIGLSWDGLLSHELDAGALVLIGSDTDVTVRLSYRSNLEAGQWLLRLDVGPAFDVRDTEFGLYAALGIAKVLDAAGGGGFF